jgi:hypothetical protein
MDWMKNKILVFWWVSKLCDRTLWDAQARGADDLANRQEP